jgi:hypothetical protein
MPISDALSGTGIPVGDSKPLIEATPEPITYGGN